MTNTTTRRTKIARMTLLAMLVAVLIVLAYVNIPMPMGLSITFNMIPVAIAVMAMGLPGGMIIGGAFGLIVLQDNRNTQVRGRIAVTISLAVKTDEAQVSVGAEIVAFTAHDGGLFLEMFGNILLQAVDDDVVAHDGMVDILPVVFSVIVRSGEGSVGAVDGTVVVTVIGHGVETVAHDFRSDVVNTVQGSAIIGEHTILKSRQVAVVFQQLIRVVRNGVEGRQIQVAGSHHGNGGAQRKYIDDLFHIRSVLSVRT